MSVRSRFRLKSLGLAPRLVALAVLLASLAGGSIAFSIISSARTALRDEILEAHLALADMMAAQISEYVSDVRAEALDLAERPEVTSAFAMNDFTVLNDQLAKWQTRRQDKIDSFAIYSIDSIDGTPLANSRATRSSVAVASSINAISRAQAVETGQPVIGRALLSKTSGTPIVPIYVPVHSASGNVEGVFCATLSLEGLTRSLVSLQLAPNSRRSVMDNVTGDVLVSEDPTKILTSFTTGRNAASQAARNGERGTMENTRSVGEATLAAYTPVPDLRWAVLLQEPSSDAFAPIDGMTRQALIWVSAAMLLAGLLAAGLALTMVRPLRKLRTTAERMASGDLGRRTGVRSGDEIGALGHAFDRMAEQLQDSVEELTRQALSDTLTALPNRVLLRQRLENAIACGDHLALLVMDLDRCCRGWWASPSTWMVGWSPSASASALPEFPSTGLTRIRCCAAPTSRCTWRSTQAREGRCMRRSTIRTRPIA